MSGGGKSRGGGARGSAGTDLLPPSAVSAERHFLVHALVSSSLTRSRLLNIHRLLSRTVAAARGVVKGTDSQRKFNAEFAQFCRTAILGLADLEDAVFELRHPGRRASEASDEEVAGIAETDFMKEVAAFVATQTSSLTAQYLEHVAVAAVGKAMRQQQEAAAKTPTSRRTRERQSIASAPGGSAGTGPSSTLATTANRGRSTPLTASHAGPRSGRGETAVSEAHRRLGDDELGLLDEHELVERAAVLHREECGGRPAPLDPGHLARGSQRAPHADGDGGKLCEGVFLSSDGRTYDLRKESLRLTAIEELQLRLEPWKMPQPYSAVELERVTAEKASRAGPSTSKDAGAGGEEGYVPLLDVCLAQTPAELLRRWERRESALAAAAADAQRGPSYHPHMQQQSDGGEAGGRRGKRRGASPQEQSTQLQRSPPLRHASCDATAALPGGVADAEADGRPHKAFFPSLGVRANVSVPVAVMRELVHNGVCSIDFLYSSSNNH